MKFTVGSTTTVALIRLIFSNPIDQEIRTQCRCSELEKVVLVWRLVIAASLGIGVGIRIIKSAKFDMFWSFEIIGLIMRQLKNYVLLELVLRQWAVSLCHINANEQNQSQPSLLSISPAVQN